jgi:hypothetical protein
LDENAIPFMDTIPYSKSYSGKIGKIIQDIFIEVLGEEKVDKENNINMIIFIKITSYAILFFVS